MFFWRNTRPSNNRLSFGREQRTETNSSEVKPGRTEYDLGWVTTFKQKPLCPSCYFLYCKSNLFLATNVQPPSRSLDHKLNQFRGRNESQPDCILILLVDHDQPLAPCFSIFRKQYGSAKGNCENKRGNRGACLWIPPSSFFDTS